MPEPTDQRPPPMPDVQATAPSALHALVGQRSAVTLLKIAMAAHRRGIQMGQRMPFPHVFLDGPPGVGKSLLAAVIGKELGASVTELLGQSLAGGEDVYAALMSLREDGLLFIDEAHLATATAQTILLRAVEDRVLMLPRRGGGSRSGAAVKHISIPLPPFTLLLATTDPQRLLGPLRERMAITLHLRHYEASELAMLCQARAAALGWIAPPLVYEQIGRVAKGSARGALRLLQAAHRVSRASGADAISAAHFARAAQLEGLDPVLGINGTERDYLRVLAESAEPRRVSTLAARLGLPLRQVSEVIEPFLIRAELIVRTDAGRLLTERGRAECDRMFSRERDA